MTVGHGKSRFTHAGRKQTAPQAKHTKRPLCTCTRKLRWRSEPWKGHSARSTWPPSPTIGWQAARAASESMRCSRFVSIPALLRLPPRASSPRQAGRSARLCPCGSSALWGAAQAADLRSLHSHERGAGVPHLADKALRLALRGAPVVIALAVILIDPDHTREHVHTRFPDGAQQGVGIPTRRLHQRLELVPGLGSFLDVARDLGLLCAQEGL